MRSVLLLGKGGVGKTTCSLALATAAARAGLRVLVASLDPAHSLGDLAGRALGDRPTRLEEGLEAVEVDLAGRRRRTVEEVARLARRSYGHLAALGLDSMTGLLAEAPGMEEQAGLEALSELIVRPGLDLLVVDPPATALATRLLALPTASAAWLERLVGLRRAILERRETIARIRRTGPAHGEGRDPVLTRILHDLETMEGLRRWLASDRTALALVSTPDVLGVREGARVVSALAALELVPRLVVVNRDRGGEAPPELARLAPGAPLVRLPELAPPPAGGDRLARHGAPLLAALGPAR